MNKKDGTPDTGFQPCFSDVDNNWRERWSMLRNFVRSWYSQFDFKKGRVHYLIPSDFPSRIHAVESWGATVDQVEQQLNITLPPSLREWHSLFNQTNSNRFNLLRDDHAMLWSDNNNMLVFRVLCEGNIAWGVRRSDLSQDDPTVYAMDVSKYGDSEDSWVGNEWAESGSTNLTVTEWLIHNFNWYLSNMTSINVDVPVDAKQRDRLLEEISKQSQRTSRFGSFLIFESTNQFAAYQDAPPDKSLKVFFASEADFTCLPAWITNNSKDHRITPS